MDFSLPLSISLGVTGKRKLKDDWYKEYIKPHIEEVLRTLQRVARDIVSQSDGFLEADPVVRVISCLCDGSDRRVAEIGLEQGCDLYAVLPYPVSYPGHVSGIPEEQREESLNELKGLIKKAKGTLQLNPCLTDRQDFTGDPDKYEDSAEYERHIAYSEGSSMMLRHSDVLLAIWDDIPSDRLGGTYNTMLAALKTGKPMIVLKAGRSAAEDADKNNGKSGGKNDILPLFIDRDELNHKRVRKIKAELTAEELESGQYVDLYQALMERFGVPHDDDAEGESASASGDMTPELREYIQNLQETAAAGCPNEMYCLRVIKPLWHKCFKALSRQRAAAAAAAETAKRKCAQSGGSEGKSFDIRCVLDDVSGHYSSVFRSYVLLACTLSGLAVTVSTCGFLLSGLWPACHLPKWLFAVLSIVEFAVIITILFYYYLYNRGKWQRKHAHYRLIAEYRRNLEGMIKLGQIPKITEPQAYYHNSGERWTDWMAWLVMRQQPFADLDFSDAGQVEEKRSEFVKQYVNNQISYHANNSHRYAVAEEKIHNFSTALFVLSLICVMAHIIMELAELEVIEKLAHGLYQPWAVGVVGLAVSALLPLAVRCFAAVVLSKCGAAGGGCRFLAMTKYAFWGGICSTALAFLSAAGGIVLTVCSSMPQWWLSPFSWALLFVLAAGVLYQLFKGVLTVVLSDEELREQNSVMKDEDDKFAQLCAENVLLSQQRRRCFYKSAAWMAAAVLTAGAAAAAVLFYAESLPSVLLSGSLEKLPGYVNLGAIIAWCAVIMPLWAVSAHAYGQYSDFRRLQLRAVAMQNRLAELRDDLEQTGNDSTKIAGVCSAICQLMVEENLEWRIQVNMPVVSLA